MKQKALIPIVAMCIFLCGCPHDEYTLEMSASKSTLHRKLTVKGIKKTVGATTLTPISKAYGGEDITKSAESMTFEGTFDSITPDDIGGSAGRLACFNSALGTSYFYVENFRGSDDTFEQINTRFMAIDRLLTLARGFLKQEVGHIDSYDKLDAFLANDFTRDLKSLAIYMWMTGNLMKQFGAMTPADEPKSPTTAATSQPAAASQPSDENAQTIPPLLVAYHEMFVRTLHFLVQKNYITPEQIPLLGQILPHTAIKTSNREGRDDTTMGKAILRRILVVKAGIKNPDDLLEAIMKPGEGEATLEKSFKKYLLTTPDFAAFYSEWKKNNPDNKIEEQKQLTLATDAFIGNLAFDIERSLSISGMFKLFPNDDNLEIRLATGIKPFMTNGKYNSKTGDVLWLGDIQNRVEPGKKYLFLPTICYAFWAVPNAANQAKYFGKVILDGGDLNRYILWHSDLAPAEAKQWDELLKTLTPENIVEKLSGFKFKGDKDLAAKKHDGVQVIYNAIARKNPKKSNDAPANK